MNGRTQCTRINGVLSDCIEVTSGVPQGSVLGPLLFLLYINDIDLDITSKCKLYADDTALYRPIKNEKDQEELQKDLDKIINWSEKWLMEFNISKCFVLNISKNKNHRKVQQIHHE